MAPVRRRLVLAEEGRVEQASATPSCVSASETQRGPATLAPPTAPPLAAPSSNYMYMYSSSRRGIRMMAIPAKLDVDREFVSPRPRPHQFVRACAMSCVLLCSRYGTTNLALFE